MSDEKNLETKEKETKEKDLNALLAKKKKRNKRIALIVHRQCRIPVTSSTHRQEARRLFLINSASLNLTA